MALFFNKERFGVDPMTQEAVDQFAALPAPIMEGRKGGGFGEVLKALAGGVLDGVATHYGAEPGYSTARTQRDRLMAELQARQAEEARRQQQRQEGLQDYRAKLGMQQEFKDPSEDSFTRAMAAAGIQPGSEEYMRLARNRAVMLTNPVQLVPDGMGGMQRVRPYGDDAPDVLDPETVKQMMGGGVSNGTGGF